MRHDSEFGNLEEVKEMLLQHMVKYANEKGRYDVLGDNRYDAYSMEKLRGERGSRIYKCRVQGKKRKH